MAEIDVAKVDGANPELKRCMINLESREGDDGNGEAAELLQNDMYLSRAFLYTILDAGAKAAAKTWVAV